MHQIRKWDKDKKKSSENKFWNLSIWKIMYQTLVRERGLRIIYSSKS